jgi:hypothetical protein
MWLGMIVLNTLGICHHQVRYSVGGLRKNPLKVGDGRNRRAVV